MPTEKKRLNLTLTKELDTILQKTAKRDETSMAAKAIELLTLALEIEEDVFWNHVATQRDTKKATFIPHDQAWV